jgi:lysophospholipase L1-like esterase
MRNPSTIPLSFLVCWKCSWLLTPAPCVADDSPSSRWEDAIQKFEESDRQQPPPQDGILFIGSSSIRMWDVESSFPDLPVINRGFGGSEVADSVYFADRIVIPYRPRTIVFYAGDNDISRDKTPCRVYDDFREFVAIVHGALPETRIVFIAIKPSLARWKLVHRMRAANALIHVDCEEDPLLTYVDVEGPMLGGDGRPRPELFKEDGLHLNEAGYAIWNDLVRPYIKSDKSENR